MSLKKLLKRLICFRCFDVVSGSWSVGPVILKPRGRVPLNLQVSDEQLVNLDVAWRTTNGNPAPVEDGAYTSSNPAVAEVRMHEGRPVAWPLTLGQTQITASADRIPGEGVDVITLPEPLNLTVVAALADPATSGWVPVVVQKPVVTP
jgi:hypothetical protein